MYGLKLRHVTFESVVTVAVTSCYHDQGCGHGHPASSVSLLIVEYELLGWIGK